MVMLYLAFKCLLALFLHDITGDPLGRLADSLSTIDIPGWLFERLKRVESEIG